ncbi:maleylpyruvate isomerase family mycothiol-dependent enzyme [Nocardia acidivorans]|uniref:maleylpyruvate isomerase family mycothiol-dependent enzyme n=1 Tax=Nocardia acidivorans TaxID=404580 RepID=UPI0008298297|nr:maleylpyruvate isomerase family mycothiol-dependent enzyme [Nocardia acidivorans]
MDRETSWQIIEQQRLAIADLLADLTPEQWQTPSLCAGWSVRQVAAHIACVPQPSSLTTLLGTAIRARGDYNRLIDRITRDYAADPGRDLVAELRAHAASRKMPRLTNYRNIHFDTIVHGQDIAIPLRRTLTVTPAAAAAGADRAVSVGWPVWDRHRLDGIRLSATDTRWSFGTGSAVHGPILSLLLLITGRPAGLAKVSGPGVELLATRLETTTGAPAELD